MTEETNDNDTASGSVAVATLRGTMRGRLIAPGDEAYETRRRVWNGMIDKRPARPGK